MPYAQTTLNMVGDELYNFLPSWSLKEDDFFSQMLLTAYLVFLVTVWILVAVNKIANTVASVNYEVCDLPETTLALPATVTYLYVVLALCWLLLSVTLHFTPVLKWVVRFEMPPTCFMKYANTI